MPFKVAQMARKDVPILEEQSDLSYLQYNLLWLDIDHDGQIFRVLMVAIVLVPRYRR
jgi:hypothetical protein